MSAPGRPCLNEWPAGWVTELDNDHRGCSRIWADAQSRQVQRRDMSASRDETWRRFT
jgi:hypothetical protein